VRKNARARIHRQLKNETALIALAPRMHANFHHALPHRVAISIARKMADGVEH
jgi:hypothetical protein